MAPSRETTEDDNNFDFNDVSNQQSHNHTSEQRRGSGEDTNNGNEIPKPKRIACVLCRKRKLKCDSKRPACSTCIRLQHDCSYDEVRKKSGPKRGYVKALEARLAQVETLLKTQDDSPPIDSRPSNSLRHDSEHSRSIDIAQDSGMSLDNPNIAMRTDLNGMVGTDNTMFDDFSNTAQLPPDDTFPWEMIGLGLDEPLPTQDVIDELNQAYFDKIHPSMPMLHRPRYYAAMNLPPHMRPPICLRYAMWALSAAVLDKYESLQEHFYNRARKYLQQDEMRGHGESMITVAHAQSWVLIATFEFKMMFFPRAWMSAGRASRLALMMGLHRIDGFGLDVKQCLPPPKDNTDREERRRTFWMAFCVDRYSSIGTGWPMVIEEGDILTNLPGDEDSFELNKPSKTLKLDDVLEPAGVTSLSAFSGVVLLACLFGRNLTHLHRPGPDDRDSDLNGDFWRRHRHMDNILLATALGLPDALRLPNGLNNPNIVFVNMSIHTSTICLHQAAIFKADRNRMPARISAESKVRCITAAAEIATIMRTISHLDLAAMNPFISFCLYVASRVFVQYLKSRPNDGQVRASLQFLLSAMHAIKRKNPLTESFLVQLDVDLEGAGLEDTKALRAAIPLSVAESRMKGCPFEATQSDGTGTRQHAFAYGDQGVAVYNNPNGGDVPVPQSSVPTAHNFGYNNRDMTDGLFATSASTPQFDLPSRQRTPGSYKSSNYRSPSNGQYDMDTSPDASNDQHTPNSSSLHNISSHTSNTAYSPTTGETRRAEPPPLGSLLNFNANFDNYPTTTSSGMQDQGYILPQDWTSTGLTPGVGTGLTPGMSTGMTPGAEMLGMTDADFQQMMDGFTNGTTNDTWATMTTLENNEQIEAMLAARR